LWVEVISTFHWKFMEILKHWCLETPPRESQLRAFDWLEKQTAKYLFLEAPVGSGKSAIGLTYSKYLSDKNGDSYVLTPQIILQNQYEKTFSKEILASLYGKNNYSCRRKKTTCDIGNLVNPKCSNCTYEAAKARAKSMPNTVFNYTYAMLAFGYTTIFDKRTLMILDECHNLETYLTEFDAITVNEYRAKKIGVEWVKSKTFKEVFDWIKNQYVPAAEQHLEALQLLNESIMDKSGFELTQSDLKQLREMETFAEHFDSVIGFTHGQTLDNLQAEYVLIQDRASIKFKRLTGERAFAQILLPKADRFLFMSSTILQYKSSCREIGIDPNDAAFISLDSEFPVENRPVYFMPTMKMNASWSAPENKEKRKSMIDTTSEILQMHKEDSGIIHTANFQIAKWLVEELTNKTSHQILHHNPDSGDNRNDIIQAFQHGKNPKILISPSITEGLDFKDDLSRFAIFVKLSFPYLGDNWIKRRMELSKEWYMRRTLIDLIQGGGRVVRSAEDWGNVYILDSSFDYLYNETAHMIPKWWKESFRKIT